MSERKNDYTYNMIDFRKNAYAYTYYFKNSLKNAKNFSLASLK